MGIVVPTVACGLGWGDYYGGYFIAALTRLVFVHHSTFCVNSLAHYAGDATYTDAHTARNSVITALVTLGEGYHNFHHEFPSDYRNGVEHWQYDPTKWFIRVCAAFGLAYNLKRFPANEIDKGMLQMRQKVRRWCGGDCGSGLSAQGAQCAPFMGGGAGGSIT
jgi:stearoyl-CoA desaturase (Delta-9 desaturase)